MITDNQNKEDDMLGLGLEEEQQPNTDQQEGGAQAPAITEMFFNDMLSRSNAERDEYKAQTEKYRKELEDLRVQQDAFERSQKELEKHKQYAAKHQAEEFIKNNLSKEDMEVMDPTALNLISKLAEQVMAAPKTSGVSMEDVKALLTKQAEEGVENLRKELVSDPDSPWMKASKYSGSPEFAAFFVQEGLQKLVEQFNTAQTPAQVVQLNSRIEAKLSKFQKDKVNEGGEEAAKRNEAAAKKTVAPQSKGGTAFMERTKKADNGFDEAKFKALQEEHKRQLRLGPAGTKKARELINQMEEMTNKLTRE